MNVELSKSGNFAILPFCHFLFLKGFSETKNLAVTQQNLAICISFFYFHIHSRGSKLYFFSNFIDLNIVKSYLIFYMIYDYFCHHYKNHINFVTIIH